MKAKAFSLLIAFSILFSCKKDKYVDEVERIRINFFMSVAPNNRLTPSFQTNNDISTGNWQPLLFPIKRFEYKPGFIYDLLVVRKNGPMPATPGAIDYKLIKVVSVKKVDKNVPFMLYLKQLNRNYITGDINQGYKLLDDIDIDCNNYCFQLENALKTSTTLQGNFIYNENGSIKLLDLLVGQ